MNNRNMLLFVVLSLGLLGGYTLLMNKLYPSKPAPAQAALPASEAAAPPTQAVPAPAPSQPVPAPAEPDRLHTAENDTMKLTWRVQDAALLQVVWKSDHTEFFPKEAVNDRGEQVSKAFPGLGSILSTRFDRVEQGTLPDATTVVFLNATGDRLTYRIPAKGHVVEVAWSTQRGTHMLLLPLPQEEKPVHGLGRIFTIEEKSIHTATWSGMLNDPFFLLRLVGSKRDRPPVPTSRLGMDAGVGGKGAQTTHYFAAIWDLSRVPELDRLGYHASPDEKGSLNARLYLGPKRTQDLLAFHPQGMPEAGRPFLKVIDFGFFGVVAQVMFWLLHKLQGVVGNWGWTILLFSFLLRILLWPVNTKSTVQMLRMKDFEPHQKAIQAKYEKYGNDMAKKQEMQKELSAFYKKNGHNPMGGCLPMLIPMPIFFALWSMLQNVFELRNAPWLGWIKDLSAPDPYYVLPVLLGASMFGQSLLTPATGDPAQRKIMLVLMPVMMVWFFSSTPTGLSLFWLVFNVVGILQTWWIVKDYQPQPVKV